MNLSRFIVRIVQGAGSGGEKLVSFAGLAVLENGAAAGGEVLPLPSSASREIGGCHLPPEGEGRGNAQRSCRGRRPDAPAVAVRFPQTFGESATASFPAGKAQALSLHDVGFFSNRRISQGKGLPFSYSHPRSGSDGRGLRALRRPPRLLCPASAAAALRRRRRERTRSAGRPRPRWSCPGADSPRPARRRAASCPAAPG